MLLRQPNPGSEVRPVDLPHGGPVTRILTMAAVLAQQRRGLVIDANKTMAMAVMIITMDRVATEVAPAVVLHPGTNNLTKHQPLEPKEATLLIPTMVAMAVLPERMLLLESPLAHHLQALET